MEINWIPCDLLWHSQNRAPVFKGELRDADGNQTPELLAWHTAYEADEPRAKAHSFYCQLDKPGTVLKTEDGRVFLIGTGGLQEAMPQDVERIVAYAVLDFPFKIEE